MKSKAAILLSLFISFNISAQAAHSMSLTDVRNKSFKLERLNIDSNTYVANCNQEAIKENIFAADARKIRSQYALISGSQAYLFDDLQACSSLNFTALLISRVDFEKNELKIKLYEASWSKAFGFKPIKINYITDEQELTAHCQVLEEGIFFKDTYLNCQLEDQEKRPAGSITFKES